MLRRFRRPLVEILHTNSCGGSGNRLGAYQIPAFICTDIFHLGIKSDLHMKSCFLQCIIRDDVKKGWQI